jgi:predicted transcriptional regulator YheO
MESIKSSLSHYISLVEFLGSVLGSHCEIVLHDVKNVEHSIVAIKNGAISNRKVGGSLTDLSLVILQEKSYLEQDYKINYLGKTKDGKILRSSTYFIKDDAGEVVGMLCINIDISLMVETRDMLNSLIQGDDKNGMDSHLSIQEDLSTPIEELTTFSIEKLFFEINIPPDRMTTDEKMNMIKMLSDKGIFLIKGSVSEVAKHLKISEATVYRYLNKVEHHGSGI